MNSLVLDSPESGTCTREQAFAKHLIPETTKTYRAVSNEELILMLNDAARKHGLVLTGEELGFDSGGDRLFGTYKIEDKDLFGNRAELVLGFCNSYDKTLRIRICMGARVFVCSNLCFSHWTDEETGIGGEAAHKHTPHVSDGLWQRLEQALSTVDAFRVSQDQFYTELADRQLGRDEAYSLILRAGKEGVINKTRILDIAKEYDSQNRYPDTEKEAEKWIPEFKARNGFNLLNAFTEILKVSYKKNPVTTGLKSLGLTNFFHRELILN